MFSAVTDNEELVEGQVEMLKGHKLDTHEKLIEHLCRIMRVTNIIIKTANFDIQAINRLDMEGADYQTGDQAGFWNLREEIRNGS